jgi:4,5-dihydroxyphthalate decarboxylase
MTNSRTPRVQLSIALSRNARTAPILDGRISAEGISLFTTAVHPSEMFWRQLRFGDFDVSEMSLASLLILKDRLGSTALDWVALPVFTSRQFFHTKVIVRSDVDVQNPADLRGMRVGVPEYQQTAAVWCRGILQEHFGLDPRDVKWFMERAPEMSHSQATGFKPPEGIDLSYVDPGSSIATMLLEGALDASLLYLPEKNLVDRSRHDLDGDARIRTLFPDPVGEAQRYYAKTGVFPVNHVVVVRRSITERYPWVILNLMNAFIEARDLAYAEAAALWEDYHAAELTDGARAWGPVDAFQYGLRSNRTEIETLIGYAESQGLTSRQVGIEEILDEHTLDL